MTEGLPPIGKNKYKATNDEVNPFRLPGDDHIFRLREDERKQREENRLNTGVVKIWDRNSATVGSRVGRLQALVGIDRTATLADINKNDATNGVKTTMPRRQEKENMIEFIAKKREMFLVQMSLDTKREEIRKLEEKAQMKEEGLQRSEQMLEEDTMRFDAFLKENDRKAHDAIKKAEEETKKKQEKTQEIKRLTQQIQALSSEMSKHRESLEDCMRYKKFLDMLTPVEWFEQHKVNEEAKRQRIRKERYEKKHKEWDVLRRKMLEQHRKDVDARKESRKDRTHRGNTAAAVAAAAQHAQEDEDDEIAFRQSIPPPPRLEDETVDQPDEEPPMYFTDPSQLMDIFAALEEQNLFLIQNSQETEHTLEELRQAFKETRIGLDAQTGQLQYQIQDLVTEISNEDKRAKMLKTKREAAEQDKASSTTNDKSSGQNQREKESMLGELHAKVSNVYADCGSDASSKPSTLFMLSSLESSLEELLSKIEAMPLDYVIKAEKEKEKKRRERKREEQQALQEANQEERNQRAIERSMQAPKKRTGRPVMYRSKPLQMERKTNDVDQGKDNNDEAKFLT